MLLLEDIMMKRPQTMEGFLPEKTFVRLSNRQPTQNVKQAMRIPVQHISTQPPQSQWQHDPRQMPVPQPTGIYQYPQQTDADVPRQSNNVVNKESSRKERRIPINVEMEDPSYQERLLNQSSHKPTNISIQVETTPEPSPVYSQAPQIPESDFESPRQVPYIQPKPAAPKPKPQWVDPRITEALNTIENVTNEANILGKQVDKLNVTNKDRHYLGIEETLTKMLLKLDSIDALGDDAVRVKRKACIKQVQQTLDALELKLMAS